MIGEPFLNFVTPSSTPTASPTATPSGTLALFCSPSDFRLLPYADLLGDTLGMLPTVGAERDCQLACCAASSVYAAGGGAGGGNSSNSSSSSATSRGIAGCTAYSWVRTSRECFLLGNATAVAPNHQVQSGVLWASVPSGTTPAVGRCESGAPGSS